MIFKNGAPSLGRALLAALCALLCLCFALGGAGCAPARPVADKIVVEDPLGPGGGEQGGAGEDTPPAEVKYSAETLARATDAVYGALEQAVSECWGEILSPVQKQKVRDAIGRGVAACEARAIAEADLLSAVSAVERERETLVAALKALVGGDNSRGNVEAVQGVFGEISAIFGVDLAGRLVYDFAVVYCDYQIEKYTEMYEDEATHIPGVLLRIEQWRQRKAGLQTSVGEENFSLLARALYSGSGFLTAAASGDAGAIFEQDGVSLTDGEVAMTLRAEGDLLSRLTLGEAGWAAILEMLASAGVNGLLEELSEAERGGYAAALPAAVSALSRSLQAVSADSVSLLRAGEREAFAHFLLSAWGDAEWAAFDALWSVSVSESTVEQYFREEELTEAYAAYRQDMRTGTLEALRAADADGFFGELQAYGNAKAPWGAFLIFGR